MKPNSSPPKKKKSWRWIRWRWSWSWNGPRPSGEVPVKPVCFSTHTQFPSTDHDSAITFVGCAAHWLSSALNPHSSVSIHVLWNLWSVISAESHEELKPLSVSWCSSHTIILQPQWLHIKLWRNLTRFSNSKDTFVLLMPEWFQTLTNAKLGSFFFYHFMSKVKFSSFQILPRWLEQFFK